MKTCTKCDVEKPYREFQKAKGYKDGYQNQCKECKYKYNRQWLKSDPEHEERAKEARKRWYEENGVAYAREYQADNKERLKELRRQLRTGEREPIQPNPTKGIPRPHMRGENHPSWKGGKRSERMIAMSQVEYREWRFLVLKRDSFQCVLCSSSDTLEAHHIEPWAKHESRRYDPDNGVTLCHKDHFLVNSNEEQFSERFHAHVAFSEPAVITEEERLALLPLRVSCHQCGAEVIKPNWHKDRTVHFCDINCKREWEKTNNWGGGRPGEVHMVPCSQCGRELRRNDYRFKRSRDHYCNQDCKTKGERGRPKPRKS